MREECLRSELFGWKGYGLRGLLGKGRGLEGVGWKVERRGMLRGIASGFMERESKLLVGDLGDEWGSIGGC